MIAGQVVVAAAVAVLVSGGVTFAAGSNTNDVSANDVTTSRPSGMSTDGMEPSASHSQQSREFRSKAYNPYDEGVMASHQGPIGGSTGEGSPSR